MGADNYTICTRVNSESNKMPVAGNARAYLCSDKKSLYEEFTFINDVVSKQVTFTLPAKT